MQEELREMVEFIESSGLSVLHDVGLDGEIEMLRFTTGQYGFLIFDLNQQLEISAPLRDLSDRARTKAAFRLLGSFILKYSSQLSVGRRLLTNNPKLVFDQ